MRTISLCAALAALLNLVSHSFGAVGGTTQPSITARARYVNAGANLVSVATNTAAGTTIYVGAGDYTNNTTTATRSLLRNGVNWHFYPGARIWWNETGTGPGLGIFDDRGLGGVTSIVSGSLEFTYSVSTNGAGCPSACSENQTNAANILGGLVITNPATVLSFTARRATVKTVQTLTAVSALYVHNCLRVDLDVEDVDDGYYQQSITIGEDEFTDPVVKPSKGVGLYWGTGETYARFGTVRATQYSLYPAEPPGGHTNNLWVTADLLIGKFYSAAQSDGYRTWVDVKELKNESPNFDALGQAVTYLGGGSHYLRAGKISATNQSVIDLSGTATVWLSAQKLSAFNSDWISCTGGRIYADVDHYEDTGGMTRGFNAAGGQMTLLGGVASIRNGVGFSHAGGTNRLIGLTIDTRGTNTLTSVTNNYPVQMASGTSNLVLQGCALLSPIATANGGAYAIRSLGGTSHVLGYGPTICTSNLNAGLIPLGTAPTTNQTFLR